MRTRVFILTVSLLLGLGTMASLQPEEKNLTLPLGKDSLKGKTVEVRPDIIIAAESGKAVSFAHLVESLSRCRYVFVGETHNSLPMHEVQARILRALYEKDRSLVLGLEMFPSTMREVLNAWSLGLLTEDEFVRGAEWYVTWNFHYGFYKEIFDFVKAKKIACYGLNAPRDLISKVRMKGWEALSDEEKSLVPKPDLTYEEHRKLIRAIFEESELPHQMKGPGLDAVFEGLYRAQSAWDETMAAHARNAAEVEGKRIVVLAGSGHLLYNLGINLRVRERARQPSGTVICVNIPKGRESVTVSRALADFVWGIREEERPAYPSVGLRLKMFEGLSNPVVESKPIDGVALGADFDKGDVILSVDGHRFSCINELRTYLSRFTWESEVKFKVLRGGQEKEITLLFEEPQGIQDKKEETRTLELL